MRRYQPTMYAIVADTVTEEERMPQEGEEEQMPQEGEEERMHQEGEEERMHRPGVQGMAPACSQAAVEAEVPRKPAACSRHPE
jgi:hypothetical protein